MDEANPELARQILLDAGADPERVVVKEYAFGWLVASREHGAACSSAKDEAFDTPQECAAHLVSRTAGPAATNPTQPAAGPVEPQGMMEWLGEEIRDWEDETGHSDASRESADGGGHVTADSDQPDFVEGSLGDDELEPASDRDGGVERPDSEDQAPPPAYPGIAIEKLSDELSIRRAQVIDRITAIEEIRTQALEERLQSLEHAIKGYRSWPEGVPFETTTEGRAIYAGAMEYMRIDGLKTKILKHASDNRRSARDADLAMLQAMADHVAVGWPDG